jgi:PAS domain S-box-containing protein
MNAEMLIALINNAALLLALAVLYDVLFFNMEMNTRLKSAAVGVIIGLIGIALMLNPWELSSGLFFDTRSILLSIVGLFFGFIPAVIGALIVASYRLYQGGIGAVTGISVTFCSVILGLLWRHYHERMQKLFGKFDLYIFGLLVHVVMLLCMLLLPWPYAFEVLRDISFPVMLIYPIGTVLLGSVLKNQLSRKRTQDALKENEAKLKNFIDNVPVGMFRISSEKKVIQTNPEMAHILGLTTPEQAMSYFQEMGERLYVDPKRREELINILKDQGHVENFEYEIVRSDGRNVWILINARMTGDMKGDTFIVDGFVLDISERKRTEKALQKTEQEYRQAYNLLQGVLESPKDIVIFALDREYQYLAFNKNHQITMEQIWGVKIEIGISMLSYIKYPADREKAKVNFDRALAGEPFILVEEYGDSSLNRRWYSTTYSPLRDAKGDVIGLTLVLVDITERKRNEEKLKEKEEQFRSLFLDSPVSIFIHDRDTGEIIDANPKACATIGVSSVDELRSSDLWLDPPYSFNDALAWIRKAAVEGPQEFEWLNLKATGALSWEQVHLNSVTLNGVERIMATTIDITERKQAATELLNSKGQLRSLVDTIPDLVWLKDTKGVYLSCNTKFERFFGSKEVEIIGKTDYDFVEKDLADIFTQNDRRSMEAGKPTVNEEEITYADDGHREYLETIKNPMYDSNGKMIGVLGVGRDITERKRIEDALLHAKREAEYASKAKSQFLANMSHELRTPLNSVIGFSDMLNTQIYGELTENQLRYVNNINESGKHLLELINGVLDLSKIEAGKMELECKYFSIQEVFDEILTMMAPLASRKNINIKVENQILPDEIFADKLKFKEIMYNLLSNAIKFTHDHGKVSVISKKIDTSIQISISDTGIGIPEHLLKDIFNPFTQVDASHKRKYGGTGLGLTLVKQFVEMHNGNVQLISEEGKGSTFTFTIANQKPCES